MTVTSPDGISIAYETRGTGSPALVFVHGWSCDRSYWAAQLEAFSRDFQVVALDLAGHGESGFGREAWTMAAFGGDVAAVVEALALDRVILVGHSMGGDAIVEAARRLPDRVAGLVWVDTYRRLGTPRTQEQLDALLAPIRADFVDATRAFVSGMFLPSADPKLVERVASDMSSAPPEVALEALAFALSFDREMPRLVMELGLPIVAINPEQPASDIASLDRHGVEVILMPGVGHFLMLEDPEEFEALLRTAIDRIGP
ncbi:MAG TPA: alpha/beta hydrolase [Gemmatimonadota bacterium]|nr:alpha/beta hydrolase [Gemmatimonadota bacterium]